MKKIWIERNKEGVSPVIATILMVAITVVLAAVLYVMVVNIRPPDSIPPAGSIAFDVQSQTGVNIQFGAFSPTPAPMDLKFIITNNSDAADVVELTFGSAPDASTVDMTATGGASATYTDMNYNGNAINAGDLISVEGLDPHTSYTVKIYHYPTDSLCSLVGASTFTLA